MSDAPRTAGPFRIASLTNTRPTAFQIVPDAADRDAIAATLDFSALRKVVFWARRWCSPAP